MFGFHTHTTTISHIITFYYHTYVLQSHYTCLKMTKITFFYGHFLAFFGIFWWSYPCQYGYIGPTFCFAHADNYYKPHYKLLTPCVYLRLTLYVVRNGKNHIFCVLGAGAWLPSQHALWADGSASYGQMVLQSISPCYPGKITCVASQHRLLIKSGSFPLSSMDYGLELGELDLRNSSRAL